MQHEQSCVCLCLGNRGRPQSISLHSDLFFAVWTLDLSNIIKPFHTQNIAKIDRVLIVASGAGSANNLGIFKHKVLGKTTATRINHGRSSQKQKQGIDPDDGFNQLVGYPQPQGGNGHTGGKIQEIVLEEIVCHRDFANSSINVALGFGLHGKHGSVFLQFSLERVEFGITHGRGAFEVVLHRFHIRGFLTVHDYDGGSVPCQIFLQQIEFVIFQEFASTRVVGLHGISENAFLFFQCQTNQIASLLVCDTKLIFWDAIVFVNG
mmetsp:Transcript_17016/g.46633  ORF Transcript_17016/g.46633 Transcript_17016/m.46633 type:complete len:264 (-) Transcript_17016:485-1276(-)